MFLKEYDNVWITDITADGRSGDFEQVIVADVIVVAAGNCYSIVLRRDGSAWTTSTNPEDIFF